MKKALPVIIIIALLLGGGYWYYSQQSASDTSQPETTEASDSPPVVTDQPQAPQQEAEREVVSESETDSPVVTADIDTSNDSPDYTPALWKVEHNGVTSYLFGSIHMGDQSMYPLPSKVQKAFLETAVLAVEINMLEINQLEVAQTVQKLAVTPEKQLKDFLSEDAIQKYDAYCEQPGKACQMFARFEPWFVSMNLEAMKMIEAGFNDQLGVDYHFLNEAKDKKEIVELESLDSQLKLLDEMPAHLQELMLVSTVTREDNDTEALVKAWKTGDVETYLQKSQMSAEEQGISQEDYYRFMNIFLYKRNKKMADSIAELLDQGKSVFAVVGAAHYGGDKSINYYLEQKGYKVTRL